MLYIASSEYLYNITAIKIGWFSLAYEHTSFIE